MSDTGLTHEALRALAMEMSLTPMASHQRECWAWMFHRIALAASPEWAVRVAWLAAALNGRLPLPVGRARLNQPASQAEAFAVGYTGTHLSLERCVSLAGVRAQLEHVLGADHGEIVKCCVRRSDQAAIS